MYEIGTKLLHGAYLEHRDSPANVLLIRKHKPRQAYDLRFGKNISLFAVLHFLTTLAKCSLVLCAGRFLVQKLAAQEE
jgi:hypothetical protein